MHIKLQEYLEQVCDHYFCTVDDILSSRKSSVCKARRCFWAIVAAKTQMSHGEIGALTGHHSTSVFHALSQKDYLESPIYKSIVR
ncbi:MAG: hypothetical protein KGN01_08140 [Patescibacteria group bacterium]|nr:hypothetical protein [Patescibacteria group bacterium]